MVGDAGAPLDPHEIPHVRRAYRTLKDDLRPEAREVVEREGLVQDTGRGCELNCVDGRECVFVTYTEDGTARCAIQTAWMEGRLPWEKPVSCHLYPVRLKRIGDYEYASFDYQPLTCSAGCRRGEKESVYLSEFLEAPFTRRYGRAWYEDFRITCEEIRQKAGEAKQKRVML